MTILFFVVFHDALIILHERVLNVTNFILGSKIKEIDCVMMMQLFFRLFSTTKLKFVTIYFSIAEKNIWYSQKDVAH